MKMNYSSFPGAFAHVPILVNVTHSGHEESAESCFLLFPILCTLGHLLTPPPCLSVLTSTTGFTPFLFAHVI